MTLKSKIDPYDVQHSPRNGTLCDSVFVWLIYGSYPQKKRGVFLLVVSVSPQIERIFLPKMDHNVTSTEKKFRSKERTLTAAALPTQPLSSQHNLPAKTPADRHSQRLEDLPVADHATAPQAFWICRPVMLARQTSQRLAGFLLK